MTKLYYSILLFCFLFLLPEVSKAQTDGISIGLRTPNEVNLTYFIPLSESFEIGASASYTTALSNRLNYYGLIAYFTRGLNKEGPGAAVHFRLKANKGAEFTHRFSLEYQQLESNTFIFDYGAFSGSTESEYEEFKDIYQDFAFTYAFLKSYWNNKIELYYEFGAHYRDIERKHSVGGIYSDRIPSDKEEEFQRFGATFKLGLNYYLFRKKSD